MKLIKKADIVLIAALLVLSLAPGGYFFATGFLDETGHTKAVIQVDGALYKEIPLSEHTGTETFTIDTPQGYNTVVVQDQSIAITEADCPDKICVSDGYISKPGEMTVCLPHKVMIEVQSADGGDPDIIPAR